jgi:Fe-S-cluster-containing hydrogenase component 2
MAKRDYYEDLCKNFEFMVGKIPNRDEFKLALQKTLSEEEIRVIFLLPFIGEVAYPVLVKKARRIGIGPERLEEIIRKLVPEGFIATFVRTKEKDAAGRAYPSPAPLISFYTEGRIFSRGEILSITEMQVRKPEDDPMRQAAAHWMNAMIESNGATIPNQTPYYRIIPIEPTLPPAAARKERIQVGERIDDPRQVLPFDVVSQMVRNEKVMAVADCYCRRTKTIMGEGCDHPTETCIYFNELASLQLNAGRARQIEADEAIAILKMAADAGLVHSLSNCEGHISCICNCCIHACGVLKSMSAGYRSAGGVSRYVVQAEASTCQQCGTCVDFCPMGALTLNGHVSVDAQRCIGCGVCAYKCPTDSLSLAWRDNPPKMYRDSGRLMRQITVEAALGMVKKAVFKS